MTRHHPRRHDPPRSGARSTSAILGVALATFGILLFLDVVGVAAADDAGDRQAASAAGVEDEVLALGAATRGGEVGPEGGSVPDVVVRRQDQQRGFFGSFAPVSSVNASSFFW